MCLWEQSTFYQRPERKYWPRDSRNKRSNIVASNVVKYIAAVSKGMVFETSPLETLIFSLNLLSHNKNSLNLVHVYTLNY